jgi:hypothetical protein
MLAPCSSALVAGSSAGRITMKSAWVGLATAALLLGAGCKENASATAACKAQAGSAACQTCCKGNGANGYKFISSECSCLGGKEAPSP